MNPLESYLTQLHGIYETGAGVAETSYYPALSNLFSEIGKGLKPKVRCVMPIADRGAGLPDGGFFAATQFQKAADAKPRPGAMPERGVVEAKGPAEDVGRVAKSEQGFAKCAGNHCGRRN